MVDEYGECGGAPNLSLDLNPAKRPAANQGSMAGHNINK